VNFILKALEYDYTHLKGLKTHLELGCEKHNAINGHLEKRLRLKGQLNQECLLSLLGKTVKDLLHIYFFQNSLVIQAFGSICYTFGGLLFLFLPYLSV